MAERKLPKDMQTPPSINSSFQEKMIVETREYELITPLFGGGVEPNTPDPVTTIRATEIRGHLRFWWRATRGGQFKTIEELKAKEDEIWGAAAKFDKEGKIIAGPSKVNIEILFFTDGNEDIPYIFDRRVKPNPRSSVPSYVAFPLQPKKEDQKVGVQIQPIYKDITFTLKLGFHRVFEQDLRAALWAWETFGGIGARTRRGFGSLNLISINNKAVDKSYAENTQSLKVWINQHLDKFIDKENWLDNVPHLSKQLQFVLIPNKSSQTYDVWNNLVNKLREFRQFRVGQWENKKDQGSSVWPEPNTIRSAFRKLPKGPYANRNIRKFPRAQFGLPIIFHMPHDNLSATLEGKGFSRLASPLILKPIPLKTGAVGLAVILVGSNLPVPLKLKDQGSSKEFQADPSLEPNEAQQITLLKGEKDVLKAFLAYLEQE